MKSHGPGHTRAGVAAPGLLVQGLPPNTSSSSSRIVWVCVACLVSAAVNGQEAADSCLVLGRPDGSCASDCDLYLPLANQLHDSTMMPFFRSSLGRHLLRYVDRCCQFSHPLLSNQPATKVTMPSQTQCGVPAPAAANDIQKRGAWPWLVALGERRSSGFRSVCGGTVISRRHVLTSAHCFFVPPQYKPKHARIGDFDLQREDDGAIPQDLDILRHLDPGYDSATHKNDIALLTLSGDIVFNEYVRPACLPFHQPNISYSGQVLTVVGYGSSSFGGDASHVPQAAEVPVADLGSCQVSYRSVGDGIPLDGSQLCAGDDQDACVGDGGGPLNHRDPATGKYYVVGIVSFGTRTCGNPNFPTVYTRVGAFLPWITAKTSEHR